MDASEFKEYIFGALFLKRASDVFDEERRRVMEGQIALGRSQAEAERRADDPDFYSDAFFVPAEARWPRLRDELHHQVGDGLNKALAALEEHNPSLEGVLQHIDFNRRVGTTTVTDRKWRDLIGHFSKYRLRNEDFEFPDLLGAAYEYLIRDFADSAGKKGGEFYTPRPVVQLMVRLVDPQQGMAVYDPCSGSGGMLIYARNHVADNGGDPADLALAGQENNGTTWSISKMNMLLHGIRDADLRNNDTLASPEHVSGGELRRFDRVITNPPFSQNYDKATLAHTERFRYGYTPEGGKKADLMFLQHMLAVLKPDGIVATVMPHGVLFRGGAEGEIRRRIIDDDLLDTVIGLGPNLFYGTGIPAAVLILRAKGSKPPERRGRVLFINADRDYREGRAQNHLRPRDEQKITATYRSFADVDGFARVVTVEELADNDFNCNIRRYADNSPPPEPQDVRAHLHGGVPMAEIDDAADLLERAGLNALEVLFADRGDGYADWCHNIASPKGREAAHGAIGYAVTQRATASPWPQWWADTVEPMLRALARPSRPRRLAPTARRGLHGPHDSSRHGPLRRRGHGRHLVGGQRPRAPNCCQPGLEGSDRGLAHHRQSQPRRQERSRPCRADRCQAPRRTPSGLPGRARSRAHQPGCRYQSGRNLRRRGRRSCRRRSNPGGDQEDEVGAHQGQENAQSHRRLSARHSPPDPRCNVGGRRPRRGHRCAPQPDREARGRPFR